MKLGLVINPLAGIGGAVGLKGSDGRDIVDQALAKGARPLAQQRTQSALSAITGSVPGPVYTAAGAMGEDALNGVGIDAVVVYQPSEVVTSADDTIKAVKACCEQGIE
ncbi:MAG: hypothetical protein KJP15_09050, partial [Gammaproteobacteria bacterium]|nr:hypothetical protein [Gammaproteobacteria bacterium]